LYRGESAVILDDIPYAQLDRYNQKYLYSNANFTEVLTRVKCGLLAVPSTVYIQRGALSLHLAGIFVCR
jgi:hypothetical protein